MKDIDFDELDRAVSSLMGDIDTAVDKPTADDHQEEAVATEEPIVPDPVGDEETAATTSDTPKEESKSDGDAAKTESEPSDDGGTAKVVTRSRGKFMDIVPGASSKTAKDSVSSTPVAKKPIIKPSAKFEDSVLTDQTDESDVSKVEDDLDSESTIDGVDTTEQITTPFLADAKVEKRPLGSASALAQEETHEETSVADVAENPELPDEQVPDNSDIDQASVPTQMPAELSNEIVSVEAGGLVADHDSKDEVDDLPDLDAPSSIPQQYKTAKSDDDQDQPKPTMYDTHQDAPRITKRKHTGVWILLVILLCIVIGAGGGYLAYSMQLFG